MSTESVQRALEKQGERTPPKAPTVHELIEGQRGEIEKALPPHMGADRLLRVAVTTIKSDAKLLQCSAQSLVGSMMVAAGLGLELGPAMGHAYLVPFKGQAQLIVGYKGLLELARRSGQIRELFAEVVREADEFDVAKGTGGHLVHRFDPWADRGSAVGYYMYAEFVNGGHHFETMSVAEVEEHRDRFGSPSDKSPWIDNFDAMAKKTMIRRAAPYLPLSVEAAEAVAADERTHTLNQVLGRPEPEPEPGTGDVIDLQVEVGDES